MTDVEKRGFASYSGVVVQKNGVYCFFRVDYLAQYSSKDLHVSWVGRYVYFVRLMGLKASCSDVCVFSGLCNYDAAVLYGIDSAAESH